MRRRAAVAATVLLLAGAPEALAQYKYGYGQRGGGGPMQAPVNVGARYRYWMADLDGDVTADDAGLDGTAIEMDSTLNMGGEHINDIAIQLPNLPFLGQLQMQLWWEEFRGEATLSNDVIFGGTLFAAGTPVSSKLEMRVWTFLWEYTTQGPPIGPTGSTGITAQAGIKYMTFEADLESGAVDEDGGLRAWVPIVGVHAQMSFGEYFALEFDINGAEAFGISGTDGTIYDMSFSAHVNISSFYAGAGYRWFRVDVTDDSPRGADEVEFDLEIVGWFFEGGIRF